MDVQNIDLLSVDHVLTTTRAVRKRLDLTRPVDPEVIKKCIEIAVQAPTALYGETWHFIVVTDRAQREAVGAIYRKAGEGHRSGALPLDPYMGALKTIPPGDPRFQPQQRMFRSGGYLVQHMHEVPLLIVPCVEGRVENSGAGAQASLYGSIFPAVWSLMLAFRARGIGSVMTTQHIQHLEKDMARVLAMPEGLTQAGLVAAGYFTGKDFKPSSRSAGSHLHWNRWGSNNAGASGS